MSQKYHSRFIIEIAGKPVENVQKALEKVKENLENETERFKIVEIDLEQPELHEETKLYSGFLEVEGKFPSIEHFFNFIIDYTPTSIEIIEPEYVSFDSAEFAGVLNDISQIVLSNITEKRTLQMQLQYAAKRIKELEEKTKQ
jgi:hypothetical protein